MHIDKTTKDLVEPLQLLPDNHLFTIDGKLWAVENDENTHGGGGLIASKSYIKIGGKSVIVQNDSANQDNLCPSAGGEHCNPKATGFSSLIDVA
jgi:hypothetical protein